MIAPVLGTEFAELSAGPTAAEVSEFLNAFDKAVRARRLYAANNPSYLSFLNGFRAVCRKLWQITSSVSFVVDETAFRWEDHPFVAGEGRENLAFFFYKDGIRLLSFSIGFEDEVEDFLEVLARARHIDHASSDDLVTLLWEREFTALEYSYVDALAEGVEIPESGPLAFPKLDLTLIAEDAAGPVTTETASQPLAIMEGKPPVALSLTREDLFETLYFLEDKELQFLSEELQKELRRDVKRDVLNALFDRLEEPGSIRQTEILDILRQLLPAYLSSGDLQSASHILLELNEILRARDVLAEPLQERALAVLAELSEPEILHQLLDLLERGAIDPSGHELGVFLRYLRPDTLAPLILASETTRVQVLQERLRVAIEQLGREHPANVLALLEHADELIVAGAARLSGQIPLPAAVPRLAALLGHAVPAVRRAAVEALVQIRSGPALDALMQKAFEDPERDVRIAAVRGISTLRYQPARPRLEAVIQGRTVRETDLTEQIAFFEAYGTVANADSVAMLDRMLNGKKLFARQSAELRACAAMALGKVGTQASRDSLMRSADDPNPMVRNAVLKALRQEVTAA